MPQASPEEHAIYSALGGELRSAGIPFDVEYTVIATRKPLRYRQVDVRAQLPSGVEIWVEIDGPNHRGDRNKDRDVDLARLASGHGAVVLHWPMWKVWHEGLTPLLEAVLRGDQDLGYAAPNREYPYKVWDSRYFRS